MTDDGFPEPWLADPAVQRRAKIVALVTVMVASIVVAVIIDARGADEATVTGPATSSTTEVTSSAPVTEAEPTAADWPADLNGRAAGIDAGEPGVYVYSDFSGWYLWVVGGDDAQGLRGTITSDAAMGDPVLVDPAVGSVFVDGTVTTFELPPGADPAGLKFNPGFFSSSFTLDAEAVEGALPAEPVRLGAGSVPRPLPTIIEKAPR